MEVCPKCGGRMKFLGNHPTKRWSDYQCKMCFRTVTVKMCSKWPCDKEVTVGDYCEEHQGG